MFDRTARQDKSIREEVTRIKERGSIMSELEKKADKIILDTKMDDLLVRLYGQEGDNGDIPDLRERLKHLNGFKADCEKRVSTMEGKLKIIILALIGSGILGGGAFGILKVLGD